MKIGLRIPGEGRKMPFEEFCKWAASEGFEAVDVGLVTDEVKQAADAAGLEIGTSDLSLGDVVSAEAAKVREASARAREAIDAAAAHGVTRMFAVIGVADPAKGRAANFEIWKHTWPPIVQYAEANGVRICIEGWPGMPPHYPCLGCTPEMLRAIFEVCPSPALGINFDPSHLVRMGIDYKRFLYEFGARVYHVHGKDTQLDAERLYEHGNLCPSLRKPRAFGEGWWRYCIPGEGVVDWLFVARCLEDGGFDGIISVELEDCHYYSDWPAQQEGCRRALGHLRRFVG